MSDEPETTTPDSSAAGSDTPRPEQVSDRADRVGCNGSRLARRDFPGQRASPIRSATERWRYCGSGVIRLVIRLGAATAHLGSAEFGERRSGRQHRSGFPLRTPRRVLTAILGDRMPSQPNGLPSPGPSPLPTAIRRRRRPPRATPALPPSRSRARHRVLRSKQTRRHCQRTNPRTAQGQDCPRASPHVSASGHARPSPLQGLRRSRHERRSGLRPQGRHGHRRLLRATQQRDNPQLP